MADGLPASNQYLLLTSAFSEGGFSDVFLVKLSREASAFFTQRNDGYQAVALLNFYSVALTDGFFTKNLLRLLLLMSNACIFVLTSLYSFLRTFSAPL